MDPLAPRSCIEHHDGTAPRILGIYLTLAAAQAAMTVHGVRVERAGMGGTRR
jgi:hypothetical protein